ncbi:MULTISPECIES: cysteine desulfurase family protein [Streptomyces]|uniref:Cysteine desulfurase n=2 Tax=Streptomyces rimosus subsp. rimosus TaxID=132474 RepID=L8EJA3_STRR1|nr:MULTISPECIES: cysteine desulfurase family protein [Streptomyces]KOG68045.1 cysteine desulfurase [Kitasatospora aureofaciens]MYT45279.1 aminotransferase class V-fold PLP-dependent enzyme [Streptomyces sp. SID5471]KEF06516.1 cysteine desulfurase [Streptomyces rimosus]KOT34691.1 cysteine desulfurase [Streptomyces sp. NRRL WC-3701]KOT42902.1 cysteine desulfurase [Streptomyces rimosus subsp. rimosus]
MVYLDHAATTPMLPEAVQAMTAQLTVTGNASSLHAAGRRARRTVEEARESLASALGARPSEVVFTAGGTEADNLAVKGLYWARRDADPARTRVLASPVEHHAVLDAVEWLAEHEGARVEWLPVDAYGRVHADALREAIARNPDDVALATVMWANNEIGTIMPVRELAGAAAEFDIPLHADAVQAFGQLEVDFAASGLAAMTVSAHKIGGPYGLGALLLRREYAPVPVLHGGGQERQVRSGTLDTPGIAAFAAAARHAVAHREEFARDIGALRDDLVKAVRAAAPDAVLGGDPDPAGRLPANAHFSFPGCEGDSLLLLLDAQGIACSTGSACTAGVAQPSHVLLAAGMDADLARGTLRFSLGHTSTEADVAAVAEAIGPVVERARSAGLS